MRKKSLKNNENLQSNGQYKWRSSLWHKLCEAVIVVCKFLLQYILKMKYEINLTVNQFKSIGCDYIVKLPSWTLLTQSDWTWFRNI